MINYFSSPTDSKVKYCKLTPVILRLQSWTTASLQPCLCMCREAEITVVVMSACQGQCGHFLSSSIRGQYKGDCSTVTQFLLFGSSWLGVRVLRKLFQTFDKWGLATFQALLIFWQHWMVGSRLVLNNLTFDISHLGLCVLICKMEGLN